MEYAKKGALGGYKAVSEADEYTHVLLTVEEYQKLQQRLQRAKDDAAAAYRDADQRVRRAQNDAAAQIQECTGTFTHTFDIAGTTAFHT